MWCGLGVRHSDPAGKIQGKEPSVPGLLFPVFQWLWYVILGKTMSLQVVCRVGREELTLIHHGDAKQWRNWW